MYKILYNNAMRLKKGDTIGIIALSGECEEEAVIKAKKHIESLGYNVCLSDNILNKNNYLAGTDEEKINCLHEFFSSKDIKLILAARGGYGAIRIINKIDYDLIKRNSKPFCGYSDVTALLLMIYKKAGITTYHSPMACTDFYESNKFNETHFFDAINNKELSFISNGKCYKNGKCRGILFGGNLSTVVSLCGLDFLPDDDFIFFAEDLNEPVYKIDKMFQQLLNIEKFNKYCKGIILGDFLDTDNANWLDNYFEELAKKLDIPIVSGFQITHSKNKITIPIGKRAIIENKILRIINE